MSFQDRVVLVTGGSKGIGLAICKHLSNAGALISFAYSRDGAAASAAVSALGGPDRALAVQADVSSLPAIEDLLSQTVAKFGRLDVVVPSAGTMPLQPLDAITEALWEKTFALNVKGPLFLAQKAVPYLAESRGRVVFVSTGVTKSSAISPVYTLYASTKGAVEQMTRGLAKELGSKGINVNCVAPGPTGTDLFYEGKSEQMVKGVASQTPFNRIGEPEEIAGAVAFLAGKEAGWVSGHVLHVNGASFV